MKNKLTILTFATAASALMLTGCVSPNGEPDYTGTGALEGGAIGAASGAAIGGRNAGAGALIGAAIGMIAGGLIGHSMDQEQQMRLQEEAPQTYVRVQQGQPLSIADVKAMSKAGVSDEVIINQIEGTHSVFQLSSADIIDLHDSGVSDKVVNAMINTQNSPAAQTTTVVVQQPPPPPPEEPVIVAPGPGYVWVSGEWVWNGGWFWRAGYWGLPPYPHAVWVHGYWYHGAHGWRHFSGHWR
ncbi:MAG TPA: YXWGXW repeat-containing protein [Candidatus Acidoferrales bacterium]|nr:YXWGXW repeat-containing protein [Candidatus Acidoferrales bacterium]